MEWDNLYGNRENKMKSNKEEQNETITKYATKSEYRQMLKQTNESVQIGKNILESLSEQQEKLEVSKYK